MAAILTDGRPATSLLFYGPFSPWNMTSWNTSNNLCHAAAPLFHPTPLCGFWTQGALWNYGSPKTDRFLPNYGAFVKSWKQKCIPSCRIGDIQQVFFAQSKLNLLQMWCLYYIWIRKRSVGVPKSSLLSVFQGRCRKIGLWIAIRERNGEEARVVVRAFCSRVKK